MHLCGSRALRKDEAITVEKVFKNTLDINLIKVDARNDS